MMSKYSQCSFLQPDIRSEDYPGYSPYTYCLANPVNYTDPTGMWPTEEAARMAHFVYKMEVVCFLGGWEWDEESKFNITKKDNGFQSMLFRREKSNGEMEYALAFAGTDPNDPKDIKQDVLQVFGLSSQYSEAMRLAVKFQEQFTGDRTFVGHSLGGGLSSVAAQITSGYAMTFNAAGVSPLTMIPNPLARIDAYVTVTDPLNILQNNIRFLPDVDGDVHLRLPHSMDIRHGHDITNFYEPDILDRFIDRSKDKIRRGYRNIIRSIRRNR